MFLLFITTVGHDGDRLVALIGPEANILLSSLGGVSIMDLSNNTLGELLTNAFSEMTPQLVGDVSVHGITDFFIVKIILHVAAHGHKAVIVFIHDARRTVAVLALL
jgi:hypothetical protein